MTDTAESAADIDVDAARVEKDAAENALAAVASGSIEETEDVRDRLELANVRIQLATR
jgi:F0F1-type ATP synthase epsilon subunit